MGGAEGGQEVTLPAAHFEHPVTRGYHPPIDMLQPTVVIPAAGSSPFYMEAVPVLRTVSEMRLPCVGCHMRHALPGGERTDKIRFPAWQVKMFGAKGRPRCVYWTGESRIFMPPCRGIIAFSLSVESMEGLPGRASRNR